MQRQEGGADCIGGEDEEAALRPQQIAAMRQQLRQARENVPDLALRPAAEFRRIEQDAVIVAAAPNLAGGEFCRIVENPADRSVVEAGKRLVLPRPGDRLLRGVNMRHLGARFCGDQRGEAGIAEEVQKRGAFAGRAQALQHERPVRLLFRKGAHMAEGGEAAGIADRTVAHGPGLSEVRPPLPAAGAFLVHIAAEDRVGALPLVGR
jgi:hypothetical protein